MINQILQGNCLDKLKELEDNSVDSIVTDPPYELGFMGKSWDNTGIANDKNMWAECLRVLKPGGHLLAFSGTRTYHRMASAIEDAGLEVRDMIEWVYGSGFPKSLNIAKMLDKMDGVEHPKNTPISDNGSMSGANYTRNKMDVQSDLAKQWEGWGTALKPSHEPICMARKPLAEKTVAENCLKWGTGGINIDESRVEYQGDADWNNTFRPSTNIDKNCWIKDKNAVARVDIINRNGRFPANLLHDNSEEVRECFPETKHGGSTYNEGTNNNWLGSNKIKYVSTVKDSGNASRFFRAIPNFKSIIYTAKASKSERNKGCEGLEEKPKVFNGQSDKPSTDMKDVEKRFTTLPKANNHPTVKPIALMEYLIKMITPKGGIVLDPFAGSGSTLVAAKQNGFDYIGIELAEEYIPIIEARLEAANPQPTLI